MRIDLRYAAGLFLPLSASAYGQTQIGETGALPIRTAPQARIEGEGLPAARTATHQFGICVVKKFRVRARQVVDIPVDDPAFRKELTSLATSDCLAEGELVVPPLILRGAIFEALYKLDFGEDFAADITKAPPFDYAAAYKRPLSDSASGTIALAMVADCAARSDPAAARLMLKSGPNSTDEDVAMSVMASKLGACIPKGQSLRFSRTMIRASLGEAVYRLSQQSRVVETAAKVTR
ncbi:MAG: hypothetical protein ACJ8FS_11990 [Sphingomicrobium sp.]